MAVRLRVEAFGVPVALDPARTYWIGTNADAEIRLRSKLAASVHAMLAMEGGRWTIRVVGTAPAIRVSSREVAAGADPCTVGPGTVLEIGGDTLRIVEAEAAASRSLANATTLAASMLGKSWATGDGPPPRFTVFFPGGADGPRQEPLQLRADRVVAGTGPGAAIRLDDPEVAAEALAIVHEGGRFRLDPAPPDLDRSLRTGDRVAVGAYDLRFVVEGTTLGINVQRRVESEPAAGAALRTIVVGSGRHAPRAEVQKSEAPRWRATSDLVRARVTIPLLVVLALVVGGTILVAGVPAGAGGRTIGAHHAEMGLSCSTCHGMERPTAAPLSTQACVGCHVPPTAPDVPTHAKHARASRPEHATIGCFGCHSIHHGFETVAATRTATGLLVSHEVDGRRLSQTELGSDHPLAVRIPIGRTIAWPVVRTQKCTSCHHVDRPGDPARRCFADFSDAAALPVLCDDEHRDEPTPEASAAVALRRAVIVPGGDLAAGRALGVRALEGQGAALDPVGAAALAGVVVLAVLAGSFVSRRRFVGDRAPVVAPPVTAAPNAPAPSIARAQLVPSVNTATCIGCAACVEVCPRGVLAIRDFWAEVVAPEACCGFMLCEAVCPNRSLTIVEGEPPSDRPKMDPNRQSVDRPGIWFAGDIAGAPLIKTAINDGVQAVDAVAASLGAKTQEAGVLDLAVVGAGPAGLAALLRSREKGLVAAAFEKGDAAQTIQLFPRRKLVRVLPLELPVLGKLPLQPGPDGAVPKEALLTVWLRLVREEGLDVRERHEVGAIRAAAGSFEIDVTVRGRGRETTRSETVRARRVIVAVGRRGTPKGLDVPIDPSMEGKIAYHLADAAALAGLTILVSGLGDAAMEAAIGLAEQESTPVHVAYRGAELKTAGRDARNVRRFRDLVDRGRIEVHWRTAVARIEPGAALLRHAETSDERRLPVDQILVFHGGTSPKELLGRFGIHLS